MLLSAALPMAAAFDVHRALDTTPLIGLSVILAAILSAYVFPMLFLRADIRAMKIALIRQLRMAEQSYYEKVLENNPPNEESLNAAKTATEYFDRVCTRVEAISAFPHFRQVIAIAGISLTPSAISLIFKISGQIGPFIRPLLAKP